MAGPSVHFHLPSLSLFKFPPDADPQVLPPPTGDRTFASPFPIDVKIYNDLLAPWIPVTFALLYGVTVLSVNKINRERDFKAYWISKTKLFHVFVVLHNVFLAIFSGLTFVAMLRALRHTWPSHREYEWLGILWPGLRTQNGLAGAADALCKMHGPRGFGDAATYNAVKGLWGVKNRVIKLGGGGVPDSTDVGRLWNEGLAFWGWFFYLSKFYEVVDTAIILLKGKKSSTLQMYHHAGAMLCMWAGIRYMSPPIWMFVFINSGVHALMYVYYTLSALGVRVPRRVKKTLTTMQISQFLIGFTFAAGHLFVSYTIPSSVVYAGKYGFKAAASPAASVISTAAADLAPPTATADLRAWLKKLAYRAAGQEGLAENVRNQWGEVFGPEAEHVQRTLSKMQKKSSFDTIQCLDTTGQSFAIWLNLIYLAPLTVLFVRFFFRSYSKRTSASTTQQTHRRKWSQSANDAAHDVNCELESLGRSAEDGIGEMAGKVKKGADKRRISETIEKFEKGVGKGYEEAIKEGKELGEKAKREASRMTEGFTDRVGRWKGETELTPQKVKEQAQALLNRASDDADEAGEEVEDKAGEVKDEAEDKADGIKQEADKKVDDEKVDDVKEEDDEKPEDSGVLVGNEDAKEDGTDKDEEPQTNGESTEKKSKADEGSGSTDPASAHPAGANAYNDKPKEEGSSHKHKMK